MTYNQIRIAVDICSQIRWKEYWIVTRFAQDLMGYLQHFSEEAHLFKEEQQALPEVAHTTQHQHRVRVISRLLP